MKQQSEKAEMLTAAKLAENWGISAAKVKKAIQVLNLEPDMKKGPCAYYSEASAAKIKKAL